MRLILIALLVTLCQAIPKRPRLLSSGRLPRLSYSNFDERLLKVGITPDDDDLPFAEELPFKVQEYHQNYKIVRFPAAKWICTKEYRYMKLKHRYLYLTHTQTLYLRFETVDLYFAGVNWKIPFWNGGKSMVTTD